MQIVLKIRVPVSVLQVFSDGCLSIFDGGAALFMDFSIIFCRGMIMDTEGDASVLMSVVTFLRGLRILVRSSASFSSLSVKTATALTFFLTSLLTRHCMAVEKLQGVKVVLSTLFHSSLCCQLFDWDDVSADEPTC